jgi:hypothetical protein
MPQHEEKHIVRKPVIIVAFALGLLACKNRQESETPYGGQSADEPDTPKDVVKDPAYGERVTLEGRVDTVYSPQTFTMKAGVFRDNLLVVAPQDIVLEALAAPKKVRVTGTVKQMVVAEVEREYAIDFDNAVKVKWEDQPYLAAESLEALPD